MMLVGESGLKQELFMGLFTHQCCPQGISLTPQVTEFP